MSGQQNDTHARFTDAHGKANRDQDTLQNLHSHDAALRQRDPTHHDRTMCGNDSQEYRIGDNCKEKQIGGNLCCEKKQNTGQISTH
ncbi:unnamed protein product [Caenorhabditis auriculariae]|uniref:Uncharacterized protein n=1 Tax=Caenorhabditis auriculariae TaxID=2777116 RepID=A0A8S1HQT4_9PELO|nr:unnamed protein product [Caenorhabditis auriculariae]